MHQFFSSVLTFFLSPFHWIVLLLLTSFLLRSAKVKKIFRVTALLVFIIFGNEFLLDWYARKWQPAPVAISPGTVYSCGIVAGGFASPDAYGNGAFNATADRFIQALKLYKLGNISHILVSGGNGKAELETFREGEFVKKELVIMGVPDSVIFVEDRSDNTLENAANARKILDSNNLKPPYLLITSAHHLPRAGVIFKNAGMQTVGYPCNYFAGRGIHTISSIIPSLGTLFTWDLYLKETAGYLWYK
ncbi:MAG: YdcF family protein [Ferruginibacter sp.]